MKKLGKQIHTSSELISKINEIVDYINTKESEREKRNKRLKTLSKKLEALRNSKEEVRK